MVKHAGREFPQDPREQMDLAVRAVFDSWNTERAVIYRRQERIPADLGTAVNICSMVFGNLDMDSGTGVAFTRDPASGAQGIYGDYLQNAQGEDVVAGIRNTVPLADLEAIDKKSYDELMQIMQTLEEHYRDLCDIEFTIERGKLWMLQTRVGKRTAAAAFRIATQLVDQGLIDMDEALQRVTGAQLAQLMFPRFDESGWPHQKIAQGMNASPGAAVGKVVFDSYTAVKWSRSGEKVILVRRETNPDDLNGMIAAAGILTSRGGKTSHAAVVARGMGKTCVCGAEALDVDTKKPQFTGRRTASSSTRATSSRIDGTSGEVFLGEVPVVDVTGRALLRGRRHRRLPTSSSQPSTGSCATPTACAAWPCGPTPTTPRTPSAPRRFGAQGIGLCRTEHMFLGERRALVEALILADTDEEQERELAELLALAAQGLHRALRGHGRAAGHHPAARPAAARVPARHHRAVGARRGGRGARRDSARATCACCRPCTSCTSRTRCWACAACASAWSSPGCSPCRPGRSSRPPPSGFAPAACRASRSWSRSSAHVQEFETVKQDIIQVAREVRAEMGVSARLPGRHDDRAAAGGPDRRPDRRGGRVLLLRHQRPDPDDVGLLPRRRRGGVLLGTTWRRASSAFARSSRSTARGSASSSRSRAERGRAARVRDSSSAVCGEHGGDPESVHFFDSGRPGLRLLLTVPGAGRPPGGRRALGRRHVELSGATGGRDRYGRGVFWRRTRSLRSLIVLTSRRREPDGGTLVLPSVALAEQILDEFGLKHHDRRRRRSGRALGAAAASTSSSTASSKRCCRPGCT